MLIFTLFYSVVTPQWVEQQTDRTTNRTDGWAGVSSPRPHPNPATHSNMGKKYQKTLVSHLSTHAGDQQTDGRTKPFISCVSAAKKGKVGQSVHWVDCQTNALVTDQPTNQLTQPLIDKHCSLSLILCFSFFSCMDEKTNNDTLNVFVSIGEQQL